MADVLGVVGAAPLGDLLWAVGPETASLYGEDPPCTCATDDRYVPAILGWDGLGWRCTGTMHRIAGRPHYQVTRCAGGTIWGARRLTLESATALEAIGAM